MTRPFLYFYRTLLAAIGIYTYLSTGKGQDASVGTVQDRGKQDLITVVNTSPLADSRIITNTSSYDDSCRNPFNTDADFVSEKNPTGWMRYQNINYNLSISLPIDWSFENGAFLSPDFGVLMAEPVRQQGLWLWVTYSESGDCTVLPSNDPSVSQKNLFLPDGTRVSITYVNDPWNMLYGTVMSEAVVSTLTGHVTIHGKYNEPEVLKTFESIVKTLIFR